MNWTISKSKTARATAGAGIAVSIPNVLSVAFMAKGYAHGRVSSSIDQQDIDYLRSIQNSDAVAAGVALDAALNGTDQITKNLNSTASGRAAMSPIMVLPLPVSSIWVASWFPLASRQNCRKPGSTTTPPQFTITTVTSGTTAATGKTIPALTWMPVSRPISASTGRSG